MPVTRKAHSCANLQAQNECLTEACGRLWVWLEFLLAGSLQGETLNVGGIKKVLQDMLTVQDALEEAFGCTLGEAVQLQTLRDLLVVPRYRTRRQRKRA